MENRYLFKAKRIDNREWEIGSLIALPTGEYEISNKCNNPPDCDPMWDKVVITHKVDPSTICRCTGSKDKNGKLIWEHDIVQDKRGSLYKTFGGTNIINFLGLVLNQIYSESVQSGIYGALRDLKSKLSATCLTIQN